MFPFRCLSFYLLFSVSLFLKFPRAITKQLCNPLCTPPPNVPFLHSLHLMMQHATSPSRSSHDPEHSRGSKREAPDVLLPQSTLDHFSLILCLHQCEHLWTSLHLPTPLRFMETLLSSPLGALNPWRDRKRLLTTMHTSCRARAGLKRVERAVESRKQIFYKPTLQLGMMQVR